jgi:hypothetical protein
MPGAGISRRPLHVIILADCSRSMKGEKIQQLDFAIREMVQDLASWEEGGQVAVDPDIPV